MSTKRRPRIERLADGSQRFVLNAPRLQAGIDRFRGHPPRSVTIFPSALSARRAPPVVRSCVSGPCDFTVLAYPYENKRLTE